MWLLDTNVWVKAMNPLFSPVKQHFHRHHPSRLFFCDVVKAELYFGAYKSQRPVSNVALIDQLAGQFPALAFDARAARVFGEIRADLNRKGTPIGPYDLQIAAMALVNDCVLVTHNTAEFLRVEGLRLEDWEV